MRSYAINEQSLSAGGLPQWPAKGLVVVGFVMLTFQGISEIIKKIAVMRGVIPDPTPFVSAHDAAALEGAELADKLAALQAEADKEARK